MGWNTGYTIMEATVVGAYDLGVLDVKLLKVLMEPYRDTDIDSGGSADFNLHDDVTEGLEPQPVYGQYPRGLIAKLLPLLRCERREILHVCSGALPRGEGIRVDVRPEARPDILADGRALPFADGSIAAAMIDPPYCEEYAESLYGVEYPRPAHLLAEAARVVRHCGRIAFVHYIVPQPPPGTFVFRIRGMSTGFNMPMRALVIYERDQAELALEPPR